MSAACHWVGDTTASDNAAACRVGRLRSETYCISTDGDWNSRSKSRSLALAAVVVFEIGDQLRLREHLLDKQRLTPSWMGKAHIRGKAAPLQVQ